MRPAADRRRGQATAEYLLLAAALAAAVALVALARTDAVGRIAQALDAGHRAQPRTAPALDAAVAGATDALSPLGARAWVAEAVGPEAADRELDRVVDRYLRLRHPSWVRDAAVGDLAIAASAAQHAGHVAVRIVGHDEERRHARRATTAGERARAGALALLLDGATTLAHRISRPLGLIASGLRLVAAPPPDDPLPPGTRAGDVIACRPVLITRHTPLRGRSDAAVAGWRVVILRSGRIVADGLSADDRACRVPAHARRNPVELTPRSPT